MSRHRRQPTALPSLYYGVGELKKPVATSSLQNHKQEFMVLKTNSRLPEYSPLTDRHLKSFIDKVSVRRRLTKLGMLQNESPSVEPRVKHQSPSLPKVQKEMQLHHSYVMKGRQRAQTHLTGRSKPLSKQQFEKYLQEVRHQVLSGLHDPQT